MKFIYGLLSAIILITLAACAGTKAPITPQQEYARASQLQDAEFYDEASAQFEEYVRKYPESDSADNAKLQIANGYFQKGEYKQAISVYQEVLASYPEGDSADQAALSIGDAYFAQNMIDEAIEAYEKLLLKYPQFNKRVAISAQDKMAAVEDMEEDLRIISEEADSEKDNAQYDIANIYLTIFGNYERAMAEFQKVVDQWPRSELADEALWNIGECYWRIASEQLPSKSLSDEHQAYMRLVEIYDRYPQLTKLKIFHLDVNWPAGRRGDSYELSYAQVRRIINKYPNIKEKRAIDFLPENYRNAFRAWNDVMRFYPRTDTAAAAIGKIAHAFTEIGNLYHNMGLKHFGCVLYRESLATKRTVEGHLGMARYYANITSVSGLPWAYRRAFYHIKEAEKLTAPGSSIANEVSWAKEWMHYKMRIEALENWREK